MFQIGDKIRFRYTGMRAEIVEDHLDGSYTILDQDDEEIIAFVDDILFEKDFQEVEISAIQQKLKKKKKKKEAKLSTEEMFFSKTELEHKFQNKNTLPSSGTIKKVVEKEVVFKFPTISPTPPSQKGCFLAFVPISATHYSIYIVNDTPASFGFEFRMQLNQAVNHGLDKVIPAYDFFAIGELLHGQFNDSPSITIRFPRLGFEKTVKLKYKKFMGQPQTIPLMGLESYRIELFDKFPPKANTSKSLKNYTQVYQADQAEIFKPIRNYHKRLNLMEHASFDCELDLHAEKLVNDTSEFSSQELFEIQLDVLDTFIIKAITLDIKEIYIIHGLGKGKLKDAVHKYLRFRDHVKSYKNEFHDRYGFGATVVKLG